MVREVGDIPICEAIPINLCFKSYKSQRLKYGRKQIIASTLAQSSQ